MPPSAMHYVSNEGIDEEGQPDVRFIASFKTYGEAAELKKALDSAKENMKAFIFHSLVKRRPGEPASHEAWHIDDSDEASQIAKETHVSEIGFDVFVGPKEAVDNALINWDRAEICEAVSQILQRFSQTGDPTGGR